MDQVQQEKASLEAERANDGKVNNIYAAVLRLFSKSSCAVNISPIFLKQEWYGSFKKGDHLRLSPCK